MASPARTWSKYHVYLIPVEGSTLSNGSVATGSPAVALDVGHSRIAAQDAHGGRAGGHAGGEHADQRKGLDLGAQGPQPCGHAHAVGVRAQTHEQARGTPVAGHRGRGGLRDASACWGSGSGSGPADEARASPRNASRTAARSTVSARAAHAR